MSIQNYFINHYYFYCLLKDLLGIYLNDYCKALNHFFIHCILLHLFLIK